MTTCKTCNLTSPIGPWHFPLQLYLTLRMVDTFSMPSDYYFNRLEYLHLGTLASISPQYLLTTTFQITDFLCLQTITNNGQLCAFFQRPQPMEGVYPDAAKPQHCLPPQIWLLSVLVKQLTAPAWLLNFKTSYLIWCWTPPAQPQGTAPQGDQYQQPGLPHWPSECKTHLGWTGQFCPCPTQ